MVELYSYQKQGVSFALKHKWVLIGDEQGLGKTIQAIEVFRQTLHKAKKALIICPGMLKYNWQNEVKLMLPLASTQVIAKGSDKVLGADVTIVSYDLVKNLLKRKNGFGFIAIDECQYIKNIKAQRTKAVHEAVTMERPDYFIALSGTPIKNHAGEFFSVLYLLSHSPLSTNGLAVSMNHYRFCETFCHQDLKRIGGGRIVKSFSGVRNSEKLKRLLDKKYIRRTAKTVLDLPPLIHKKVELGEIQSSISQKELKDAFKKFEEGKTDAGHLTQAKADNAFFKATYTFKYCMDLIEQGEKVVIFTDHLKSLDSLVTDFASKGVCARFIRGSLSSEKRQEAVEDFQKGSAKVLVCTYGSAATGFTLTAAKNMVLNDMSWVPADVEQAMKRIHRIGQKGICVIHWIVGGEVDGMIQGTMFKKLKILKEIL